MPLNEHLDVLGQQPALFKLYTQISLIYALLDGTSDTVIIDTLTNGLARLSESFPWIAGQVINIGENGVDDFRIAPLDQTPRLTVKDLRDSLSMDGLRKANYPMSMLDENLIAPCNTLAGLTFDPTAKSGAGEAPIFLVQVSFIKGGLILTMNAQHNVMDMTGQGAMISLLSKACRGESFTEEEIKVGNMDRENLVQKLENYTPGPELDAQMIKPPTTAMIEPPQPAPPAPPSCTWAYFIFSSSSLEKLKAIAASTLPSEAHYTTTDDALSAFIWQSILHARAHRLDTSKKVTFARAVDARRYLEIPSTYPGIIQNMTYHTYALSELLSLPLGVIASNLREAVDPKTSNLSHRTRSLVTFIQSAPENKTRTSPTANLDLSVDITLSSWAKVNCYDLDFGLGLGKPEAVRRPRFVPVESLLYLMPKKEDGEIAAAICLRDEDMARLRDNENFAQYGNFIG